jgi:hypothetical protein
MRWLHANGKPVIHGPFSHLNHIQLHIWILKYNFFPLISRIQYRGDGRHAIMQLIGDRPQQMATTIW